MTPEVKEHLSGQCLSLGPLPGHLERHSVDHRAIHVVDLAEGVQLLAAQTLAELAVFNR
jgi:hypothetical protein